MRKIDAVITWVDGSDPEHRSKRLQAMQTGKSAVPWNANLATRFGNTGEIYFCIASILKYAPFIRKIFIVTDAQAPKAIECFSRNGICDPERIEIIDHYEIFRGFTDYLPTFNSLSIETMIWRIPGLTEEFISFNDDMFLVSENKVEDYVLPDGKLVLYGTLMRVWPRVFRARLKRLSKKLRSDQSSKFSHKLGQAMAAHRLGYTHYLAAGHTPKALRKSTLAAYFSSNTKLLETQIRHKFRSREQVNPIALANVIEVSKESAVIRDIEQLVCLEPRDLSSFDFNSLLSPYYKFGCIQSADEFDRSNRSRIYAILLEKFRDFLPEEIAHELTDLCAQDGDVTTLTAPGLVKRS